jgi:predicted ATPase/DNA-binding SARP family transcriptional activator
MNVSKTLQKRCNRPRISNDKKEIDMSCLALYFFGPLKIELNGQPVKIDRHKAIALLAYLAVTSETHHRNTLAALLWPNLDQQRALAALRRALATLKKAGLAPWLETERETIRLNPADNIWIDIAQFYRRLENCLVADDQANTVCLPLLTEAVNLHRADFMAGFSLRDSPDFDEWQLLQAETLRRDLTSALARLVRCHSSLGNLEAAIHYAGRWLEIDPLYELAHRQLMQLYTWNNQRPAALRQYQACFKILQQELGIEPAAETTTFYEQILNGQITPLVGAPHLPPLQLTPLPASQPQLRNFPAFPTPFIGRVRELAEIANRLQRPDCQLLTLTGPGGIGKTRLSVQTAIEHKANFPDGLYFSDLTSVPSPDFLMPALADALQLAVDRQTDVQTQLINYLKNKNLLLVMDNFEHLTPGANALAQIVAQSPHLKILVTSRERLNLQGEWTVEIKGMRYPANHYDSNWESYSAIALFLRRAYRVQAGLTLTEADKYYIVRICQLLEGVPLAIELAATWMRVLSCQEIAREIARIHASPDSLDFLATPMQDIPKRHQSLRLVFEHSWQLLSAEEKQVFSRLAVFQGGCQREAIEAITGANLTLVSALVDKSLLTRSTPQRYLMHELLRHFAAEKLRQTPGAAQQLGERHCDYYTTFLQQREMLLKGERQIEIMAEIAVEIENIRAAWRWAISQQNIRPIQKSLESLWYFYAMYSRFAEGAQLFGEAISKLNQANHNGQLDALIGRVMAHQGWFLLRQGLYDQAKALLQQSIAILRHLNDQDNIATPLHYLGILNSELGNLAEAQRLLQKCVAIYRKTNNRWGVAWSLSNLAYGLSEKDEKRQEEAKQLLEESVNIYKAIGNKHGIAIALNNLGYIIYRQQDYLAAKTLLEESLALRREIGYPRGIAVALNNLGQVVCALGEYEHGKQYYYEALEIAAAIQTIPLTLAALGGLAIPLAHEGKIEQALELLNLALHHPASNKETKDQASDFLAKLKSQLPGEALPAKSSFNQLETVVAKVLAEYRVT